MLTSAAFWNSFLIGFFAVTFVFSHVVMVMGYRAQIRSFHARMEELTGQRPLPGEIPVQFTLASGRRFHGLFVSSRGNETVSFVMRTEWKLVEEKEKYAERMR